MLRPAVGLINRSWCREKWSVRETAIVAVLNVQGRCALIDGLEAMDWRVRVVPREGPALGQACVEPGVRLVFVEWPGESDQSTAGGERERNQMRTLLSNVCLEIPIPLIAIGADPCAEDIVSAMKAGAKDFLALDPDSQASGETLAAALLRLASQHVIDGGAAGSSPIEMHLAGSSRAAVLLRSRLEGLATLPGPVLVYGEAGSGRDTVARALHAAGPHADAPFRKIECDGWHPGDSLPDRGTVYLDHVERLMSGAQKYWVHCLSEARRSDEPSLRFVASAGPGFAAAVREDEGSPGDAHAARRAPPFDAVLRVELMRFPIELVPLRDRLEDVPTISDQIVRRMGAHMKREVRLTDDAYAFLAQQGWPGNVAQLARLLERAVAFCASGLIDHTAIEQLMDDFEESLAAIRRKREIAERDELLGTLVRTGGNISRCAENMGRSRGAIYRLIQKYGIALPRNMKKVDPSGSVDVKVVV